mmetsp:Transcript_747/g.1573  ORF Transcript_747/g.1573 Transcript_747/m.1573 type:complete len:574 (+) Transcript_747:120-1841(+)
MGVDGMGGPSALAGPPARIDGCQGESPAQGHSDDVSCAMPVQATDKWSDWHTAPTALSLKHWLPTEESSRENQLHKLDEVTREIEIQAPFIWMLAEKLWESSVSGSNGRESELLARLERIRSGLAPPLEASAARAPTASGALVATSSPLAKRRHDPSPRPQAQEIQRPSTEEPGRKSVGGLDRKGIRLDRMLNRHGIAADVEEDRDAGLQHEGDKERGRRSIGRPVALELGRYLLGADSRVPTPMQDGWEAVVASGRHSSASVEGPSHRGKERRAHRLTTMTCAFEPLLDEAYGERPTTGGSCNIGPSTFSFGGDVVDEALQQTSVYSETEESLEAYPMSPPPGPPGQLRLRKARRFTAGEDLPHDVQTSLAESLPAVLGTATAAGAGSSTSSRTLTSSSLPEEGCFSREHSPPEGVSSENATRTLTSISLPEGAGCEVRVAERSSTCGPWLGTLKAFKRAPQRRATGEATQRSPRTAALARQAEAVDAVEGTEGSSAPRRKSSGAGIPIPTRSASPRATAPASSGGAGTGRGLVILGNTRAGNGGFRPIIANAATAETRELPFAVRTLQPGI